MVAKVFQRSANLFIITLLSIGLFVSNGYAVDVEFRWAILADPQVSDSGMTDLLTVGLAALPGLELVDRADIARVLREQELSPLASAEGAPLRLQVGKILRADAMVLLATDPSGQTPRLSAVIVDCHSGTRLWMGPVTHPAGDLKASVGEVIVAVEHVRQRFVDGIRCSIGVLPFVSEDLVHDFDRLQLGLCRLLQQTLLDVPGIAVIEVEEVRAIAVELQGRTQGIGERVVPLIVEGQFSTVRSKPESPPTITMTIRLMSRKPEPMSVQRVTLPLPEVETYFSKKAVLEILEQLEIESSAPPVASGQQFERLVGRADRLAGLSAYPEALGLREAALLIKPADAALRRATINEYLRALENTRTSSGNDLAECLECIRLWRIIREHVDYLIRNRLVTQVQACGLIKSWVRSLYVVRVDNSHRLKGCEVEKKKFLVGSFRRVQALERGSGTIPRWNDINSFFLEHLLVRLDGNFHNDDDLQPLLDLVTQFDPKARHKCQQWAYALSEAGTYSAVAHARFCKALQASPNAGIAAAGRYADFCRRYSQVAGTEKVTPAMLVEAGEIRAALKKVGACDFYLESKTGSTIAMVRRDVKRFHQPKPQTASAKRPQRPAPRHAPKPEKPKKPQIRLEPLLFEVRSADGSPRAEGKPTGCSVLGMLNCGEFDVLWSEDSLYLHEEEGVLSCLLAKSDALIEDVKWDGRYLWVGTRRTGLLIYDRAGTLLAKVTSKDGLPPVAENVWRVNDARSLLLHPVAPGKVLMVAQIMQNPKRSRSPVRSWCAIISYEGKKVDVDLFHEARRTLAGGEDAESLHFNAAMGFRPTWILEHSDTETGARQVYVGRDFLDGMWRARKLPLRVDVDSLEVSVAESRPSVPAIDLPAAFTGHRGLLSKLSDRPGKWGVSALSGVVAWPRYGGGLQKVVLMLPEVESP